MSTLSPSDKLSALRKLFQKNSVNAYLIPAGDAHQSEYIAKADARRSFISNFTGSAGYAVVTDKKAALWTDGRYYLQASKQLSPEWILMKDGLSETPSKENWLLSEAANGAYRVAYDPLLISVKGRADMVEAFKKKNSKLEMVSLKDNLVDHVWADQRPKRTENPVFVLDEKFTGESVASKLKRLREALTGSFIVTALDEVAWLLNLRGNDIPYNPVFFSYVLVTPNDATLYTNPSRVPADVKKYLETAKVALKPYENVFSDLHSLSFSESKKLLATNSCNCAVEDAVNGHLEIIRSPIMLFKAVKNTSELKGFEECHKRDAAALCNFFGWLEHELLSGKKINECEAADKAEELRSKQDLFMGLSFDTISSTGANAAIIHYSPKPESCATINKDEIFLFDSGGQYKDGTTDVTRTYHFGTPNNFEKDCFTRVLKGHIAIDKCIFPEGTTGYRIDILARNALWQVGLNFLHGTGHGVGHFLNVHEGPHGIGFRRPFDDAPLTCGMIVTDEPGYYHDGEFGIRIENILIVESKNTKNNFPAGNGKWFGFRPVTLVPLGLKLIDKSILNKDEIEWINNYHKRCLEEIKPLLEKDSLGYKWLIKETAKLE